MIVKQVTLEFEKETERVEEALNILASNDINLVAINLNEKDTKSILRMMVSDPELAYEVLEAAGFSVKLVDVICIRVSHAIGSLYKAIKVLREGKIQVEYMYAFANGEDASAVMKCSDLEKAIHLLEDHDMGVFRLEEVYRYL